MIILVWVAGKRKKSVSIYNMQKAQNRTHWGKIKVLNGAMIPPKALEMNSFPYLFHILETASSKGQVSLTLYGTDINTLRNLYGFNGLKWIIPDNLFQELTKIFMFCGFIRNGILLYNIGLPPECCNCRCMTPYLTQL